MISNRKHKRERAQGLVEFALVLPLLLLILVGLAEFARIFAIYSNLFNAAREGTRYGIVEAHDTAGIVSATQAQIALVDQADVLINVSYDSGPGTDTKSVSNVNVGDRVRVSLYYDVQPMIPLLQPLLGNLYVETVAARTIAKTGPMSLPAAGEAVNLPTGPVTLTPGAQLTPQTPPAVTSTPTPDIPLQIAAPLTEDDVIVTGRACPNGSLTLRDIQDPSLSLTVSADGSGLFRFNTSQLQAGHVIVVQGCGDTDWEIVQAGGGTATLTPTPMPTPTPTPTPGAMEVRISPPCGPPGGRALTVNGYNYPNKAVKIYHVYGGVSTELASLRANELTNGGFSRQIAIANMQPVTHTIEAHYNSSGSTYTLGGSATFLVPCPAPPTATPTSTPSYPNLIVESITLANSTAITTHVPLTFTISVANVGDTGANSLFWVDLYIDPTNPISPTNPLAETSSDWAAVSMLGVSQSVTLTLSIPEGISTTGAHAAWAVADTWQQVGEDDELDNELGPVSFGISASGDPPTPTVAPTAAPIQDGAISGSTWLFINADIVAQGRVNVKCYGTGGFVAETDSDEDGNYLLPDIPPGTYTVIGEMTSSGQTYTDVALDVIVVSAQTTQYVTLFLH